MIESHLMTRIDQEPRRSKPEILIEPKNRQEYLYDLLKMDGLKEVQENPKAAYCALSLTNTPDVAKSFVADGQTLLKRILKTAGIDSYDPGTAPLSPDLNLTEGPGVIYKTDLARVASARFFTAFDTFPSTGMGVELEAARRYNRIPVIFHDDRIRTSRMQPDCSIHVGIEDLEEQAEQVTDMFTFLQTFEPGRGLVDGQPVLLGFKNGEAVNLTEEVSERFPELNYTFDGTKPALKFAIENHGVLFQTTPK